MSTIAIQKCSIIEMNTDCIVNAANTGLRAGSGVCGAIFSAAGHSQLQQACREIGHCDTGDAVITLGFQLPARYIIHAVGPIWQGGNNQEAQLLYSAYSNALRLAMECNCHSIAFPLISAGIYGYPKDQAWRIALHACRDYLRNHPDYELHISFAVLDDGILELGLSELERQAQA